MTGAKQNRCERPCDVRYTPKSKGAVLNELRILRHVRRRSIGSAPATRVLRPTGTWCVSCQQF